SCFRAAWSSTRSRRRSGSSTRNIRSCRPTATGTETPSASTTPSTSRRMRFSPRAAAGCCSRSARSRAVSSSGTARCGTRRACGVGCGALTVYLAPHGHHRLLAAAAVVGLLLAVAGTWIVLRVPWLLALATLACVPARIPVHVGSTQANLLLPLYAVVVVAALALAWQLAGNDDRRTRELGPIAWPLGLFVAWEGLTFLWTKDVRQGAIELLFFVLPFGLLAVALARLPWARFWVLTLYAQYALMAVVFAAIGVVQYETRQIFWNPKVRVDNAYAPSGWFYRV